MIAALAALPAPMVALMVPVIKAAAGAVTAAATTVTAVVPIFSSGAGGTGGDSDGLRWTLCSLS